ncbi:hypothetical protein, partial [Enterocloster sp.]|uniref:hypothetical protein n=1 Tax=Enterocloster sp. TaxID=2719315 RepID=UPI003A9563FF
VIRFLILCHRFFSCSRIDYDYISKSLRIGCQLYLYTIRISQLTDTSVLNDWDILNTSNFTNMFLNCPSHPEFTKRPGTWDGNGTFIPSA